VVTTTSPIIVASDGLKAIGKDVINATAHVTMIYMSETIRQQLRNCLRSGICVEVSHEYDGITWLPMSCHEPDEIVRCCYPSTEPSGIDGKRAMVVNKENDRAGRQVFHARPLCEALPEVLVRHLLILRYHVFALL
jgi:hypothetical protein